MKNTDPLTEIPSVYQYTDFREYLRRYFTEMKGRDSKFSYQFFADQAGFKSKSYIHLVASGGKALSRKSIFAFSRALGHDAKETRYFETLVSFNQAKTLDEKEHCYTELRKIATPKRLSFLQTDQYEFFSHWYIAPIRELVCMHKIDENWTKLARLLDPAITPTQARKAVELLLKMGMIQQKGKSYEQKEKSLHTGNAVRSLAVSQFQRKHMDLAKESMDRHAPELRDITTLTFGVDEKGQELLRRKILEFRQEIADLAGDFDQSMDRVYQLNLQFFPLSKVPKKDK